jgi:hypothetical protein
MVRDWDARDAQLWIPAGPLSHPDRWGFASGKDPLLFVGGLLVLVGFGDAGLKQALGPIAPKKTARVGRWCGVEKR